MTARVNYFAAAPELMKAWFAFSTQVAESGLEKPLLELVKIRASQINGCAFCVDMHVKEAKIHGERELRLHHVTVWRESTLFSAKERAILEWTEALTQLGAHGVSDAIFASVRAELSDEELADLSFLIVAINGWNRLSVAFRAVPGSADKIYGLDKAGLS